MPVDPAQLDAVFGLDWSQPKLFYSYNAALRFTLATGTHPINRMHSAITRSIAISRDLFGKANDLHLAVLTIADANGIGTRNLLAIARGLQACDLPPLNRETGRTRPPRHTLEGEDRIYEMVMPISREQVCRVLWAAVATDLGMSPTVDARLYIAPYRVE